MRNKLRVLSIDGGGLRGVIPLKVIEYIEQITEKEIHQTFDVIAGTSTGALLASTLLCPDVESEVGDKRRFDLSTIEKLYISHGKDIFPRSSYLSLRKAKFRKYLKYKYSPDPLDAVLNNYLGESRIADCLRPVFITSFDLRTNSPLYFTTREANLEIDKNILLKKACRATSAAPSYFPSYELSYAGKNCSCIDGGIFMNNPALGVLLEVVLNRDSKYYKLSQPSKSIENIHILSLGTGSSDKIINVDGAKSWGEVKWAKPAIDLAMNVPANVVDQQLQLMYELFGCGSNYLRLNVDIESEYSEMSNSSGQAMDHWIREVKSQIVNNSTAGIKIRSFLDESGVPNMLM